MEKQVCINDKLPIYDATNINDRIPTIETIQETAKKSQCKEDKQQINHNIMINKYKDMRNHNHLLYRHRFKEISRNNIRKEKLYSYCLISVIISFIFGLSIGVVLMGTTQSQIKANLNPRNVLNPNSDYIPKDGMRTLNSLKFYKNDKTEANSDDNRLKLDYTKVTFTGAETQKYTKDKDIYPKSLTENMKEILKDNKDSHVKHNVQHIIDNRTNFVPNDQTVLYNNIYWGPKIENSIPQGYGENSAEIWEKYVEQSEVTKMEAGCGRMQNRLITFKDGIQACVRYRQNTDQIQGEIFSFYVARLLNLTNLAPSVVKVVDIKEKLWQNVAADISNAQWNQNRAVVLTQYIPSLESATIPEIFKPSNRHLNKFDVLKMSLKDNDTEAEILLEKIKMKNLKTKISDSKFDHIDMNLTKRKVGLFVELAQWSDLIIFDYLTANLDRIVNNLFNYQWNVNIMDGPAHNLARKMDSGLLLFLDNESGLLHGYRLLKKYNMYHSLMLDNLCMFRKSTVASLRRLYESHSVGKKLSDVFHKKNNAVIRDILPPLPEKNAKILHERIGKVLSQIDKCEQNYSNR